MSMKLLHPRSDKTMMTAKSVASVIGMVRKSPVTTFMFDETNSVVIELLES